MIVLVLVFVALLSLACFTFSELMLTERKAADLSARRAEARAFADSGIEMARLLLQQPESVRLEAGGCYDNPQMLRGVVVDNAEEGGSLGRFTIIAPSAAYGTVDGLRYGLQDESGRLNLNALLSKETQQADSPDQAQLLESFLGIQSDASDGSQSDSDRAALMGLPGMTEEIADAILDWIDPDDETRQYGAEADYYASLAIPYAPKNGPLETIEELLLVRGVTPELLLGADANRNAMVEPYESALAGTIETAEGSMDRGWSAYLTLHSAEANTRLDGEAKVDLNQSDMEQLHAELEESLQNSQWAAFIVALRQYGPYGASSSATGFPWGNPDPFSDPSPSEPPPIEPTSQDMSDSPDSAQSVDRLKDEIRSKIKPGMSIAEVMAVMREVLEASRGSDGNAPQLSDSEQLQMATELRGQLAAAMNAAEEEEELVGEPFPDNFEVDLSKQPAADIESVLDLIGAKIEVESDGDDNGESGGEKKTVVYRSPFSDDPSEMSSYLPILMEMLTTDKSEKIAGRININQASPAVLQGIPGITPEMVNQILTQRQPDPLQADASRRHATWLLSEGIVTLDEMKQLMPYVTGAGSVYRVQSIGYFDRGGPAVRVEAVLDATTSPARLRQFRDLSHLGRGYALETLGIQ